MGVVVEYVGGFLYACFILWIILRLGRYFHEKEVRSMNTLQPTQFEPAMIDGELEPVVEEPTNEEVEWYEQAHIRNGSGGW